MEEEDYVETSDVEEREERFWRTPGDREITPEERPNQETFIRDVDGPPRKRIKLDLEGMDEDMSYASAEIASPLTHSQPQASSDELILEGPSVLQYCSGALTSAGEEQTSRNSLDPLLLGTQDGPSSPRSTLNASEEEFAPEGLFTPPEKMSDLSPSTSRSPTRSPTFTSSLRSHSDDCLTFLNTSSPTIAIRSSQQPSVELSSPANYKAAKTEPRTSTSRSPLVRLTNTPTPPSPLRSSSPLLPFPSFNASHLPVLQAEASQNHFFEQSFPAGSHSASVHEIETRPSPPRNASLDQVDVIIPPDSDDMRGQRYSLRARRPEQKKPYTADSLRYTKSLRHHPDAIVRLRSPHRSRDQYGRVEDYEEEEEGEESQQQAYDYDRIPGHNRHLPRREPPSELLRDMSESDDDIHKTRREAQSLGGERQKKHVLRLKKFPLTEMVATHPPTRSPSIDCSSDIGVGVPLVDDNMDIPFAIPSDSASRASTPLTTPSMDDEDGMRAVELSGGSSVEEPESNLSRKARKQLAALSRMMPHFMIQKTLNKSQQQKPRSTQLSDSDETETPLQPGQSKTRLAKNPRDIRDIRGDSETSSSEDENRGNIIELSSEESSDDGLDDKQIRAFISERESDLRSEDKPRRSGSARESNHIDFMLAGANRIGLRKRSDPARIKRAPRKSTDTSRDIRKSYALDIVASGARKYGRERQTLLNFRRSSHPPASDERENPSHYESQKKPRRALIDFGDTDDGEDYATRHGTGFRPKPAQAAPSRFGEEPTTEQTRKKKEKRRRVRAKANGLYTFVSNDTRLESRKRKDGVVTIHYPCPELQDALKPTEPHWSTSFPPQPDSNKKPRRHRNLLDVEKVEDQIEHSSTSAPPGHHSVDPNDRRERKNIWAKLGLNPLPSAFSFAPESLIKKQYLSELLVVLSSEKISMMPAPISLQGVNLDPERGIDNLRRVITKIFNGLLDLQARLPSSYTDPDQDQSDWQTLQRSTLQAVSAFQEQAEFSSALTSMIEEEVRMALSRGLKSDMTSPDLEMASFSYIWFLVELAARLKLPHPHSLLEESIHFLVHALMKHGLRQTMSSVDPKISLVVQGRAVDQRTAELWVQLYHLLEQWPRSSERQIHPLWKFIQHELESMESEASQKSFDASEAIWRTVFSVCTLTQFSKHGMVTSNTFGPACWELIVTALRKIRLQYKDQDIHDFLPRTLNQRDGYIIVVTLRCFYLWEQWHWPLEDALHTDLFNILVEIFRSRHFTKLRGESDEFPSFMAEKDWRLLSKHEPQDTAYCLFIKLLVQAVQSADQGKLSSRSRKLLSLAIPVGSLPYSKGSSADVDLSMYVNRLSAIAVIIYLDPSQISSRITQAQKYVEFADVNGTVRNAVLRGMMMLATLLKKDLTSREPIAKWVASIATTLVEEFKSLKSQASSDAITEEIGRTHILICGLIICVQYMIDASKEASQYPDTNLITSLLCILSNQGLTNALRPADCVRRLLLSLHQARKQVLPDPARPALLSESQDEYAIEDFDWDDPAIAALDGLPTHTEQERILAATINQSGLLWLCWRQLSRLIKTEKEHQTTTTGGSFDSWMDCWLLCTDLVIPYSKKTWPMLFNTMKDAIKDVSPIRGYRVELRLMSKVLKLQPKTYLEFKDRYFEVLMVCFACINSRYDLERDFVDFLLEIDGCRHPLLLGYQVEAGNQGSSLTGAQFLELRRSILGTLFQNLANLLIAEASTDDVQAHENNESYGGFVITMFQAMQARFEEVSKGSNERQTYMAKCQEVFQMLRQHQVLRSHSRLTFWIGWERTLC